MFKVMRGGTRSISHVQGDGRGCRGVSHVQGDGGGCRGVSHVQGKARGVSHVQSDEGGIGASAMFNAIAGGEGRQPCSR